MDNNNYFTKRELQQVVALINFLTTLQHEDPPESGINVEAKVFDANGEVLGRVTITDGGEYGLYPGEF